MLALVVEPFESDQHLYEIKWDGFRSLCMAESKRHRLLGRRKTDFTERFHELDELARLPAGTILDGEIVHMTNGKPNFHALLSRERAWVNSKPTTRQINRRKHAPVIFVAFDILYDRFKPIMNEPLATRRERLESILDRFKSNRLVLSEAHYGNGLELFHQVNKLGLEGVVAKRMDGIYEPGRRSGLWVKFKRRLEIDCVIIGYEPNSTNGIKSLLLAADVDGEIKFIGQVGSGLGSNDQLMLLNKFSKRIKKNPPVAANIKAARWLKPDLSCRISFMEWTSQHKLRAPVFEKLL